jgi:hypothetical protein
MDAERIDYLEDYFDASVSSSSTATAQTAPIAISRAALMAVLT